MPEHHHESGAESRGGELHAADLRRCDDVARDADDEQVPEALVEHDLGRHACIGAAEHDRERLLPADRQFMTWCTPNPSIERGPALESKLADEAAVACMQRLQCGSRPNHRHGFP
jgi:hypothetical protein